MQYQILVRKFRQLLFVAGVVYAPQAAANNLAGSVSEASWNTASHLGFAINDTSSTGFKLTGGTMVMLDASRAVGPRFELGLRTIASGAQNLSQQFYRLGAGPLATLHLSRDWLLQAAFTSFNETGLTNSAERSYQSSGQQVMIGWERVWQFDRRVEASLGGFAAYHNGHLAPANQSDTGKSTDTALIALPSGNHGVSHGIEAALRLRL